MELRFESAQKRFQLASFRLSGWKWWRQRRPTSARAHWRAQRALGRDVRREKKLAAAEPFGPDQDQRSEGVQFSEVVTVGLRDVTRQIKGRKRRGSGRKGLFAAGPRRLCRGIDERPFPRHQLGEKPAACRAEHEAVMLMAEIKPQVRMARHPADDRQHVSPAGTAGSPSSSARSRPHNAYGRRG